MAPLLGLLAFVFAALFGATLAFYLQAKRDAERVRQEATAELDRFKAIRDLEHYKTELDAKLNKARADPAEVSDARRNGAAQAKPDA